MDQEDGLGFQRPSSFYVQKNKMLLRFERLHYILLPLWNTELFKSLWGVKFLLVLAGKKEKEKKDLFKIKQ